jgi:hypothetical protein
MLVKALVNPKKSMAGMVPSAICTTSPNAL